MGGPRPRLDPPLVDRNSLLLARLQIQHSLAYLEAVLAGHGEALAFLQQAHLNAEAARDTLELYR
jgi:hypothetical protein